jgi:hypothetical protein
MTLIIDNCNFHFEALLKIEALLKNRSEVFVCFVEKGALVNTDTASGKHHTWLMAASYLLPPRESQGPFSLIHLLLPLFQDDTGAQLEAFNQRVEAGQRFMATHFMATHWRTVTIETSENVSSAAAVEGQMRWIETTVQMAAADEWLEVYGETAIALLR